MIDNEKKIKEQKTLCLTICSLISYLPITNFINNVFNLFVGEGFIYDSLFCYVIFLVLIIKSLFIVSKKMKKDVFIFMMFLLVYWIISYMFFQKNQEYMFTSASDVMGNPFYKLFVFSFSGYIFSRYIEDYKLLEEIFLRLAIVVVISSTISFFITLNKDYQKEYMTFSYNMLIHVAFLMIYYFEQKNAIHIVVGILGFIIMFMAGCRGSIVCCMGTILIYLIFRKTELKKKIGLIIFMSAFVYIFTMNFQSIISFVADIAENLNINSRTISLIESGDFFYDSGRDVIKNQIIEKFNMLGHGLYGDRTFADGSYAHQFIIEIISQFGFALGIPILIIFFSVVFKGLFATDKNLRNLIIIFLSAGLFKLFFSSSYLNQEPAFYILLGLCINSINYRNENKEANKMKA